MNTLKSIGAVLAGFLVVVLLSAGTDFLLESAGIFPQAGHGIFITWMLLLAFAYRILYTLAGGYVTAALSPASPMRHVIILAIIGTVGGIAGIIVGWDLSDHWYPIALAITAFPVTWLGGKIRTRN